MPLFEGFQKSTTSTCGGLLVTAQEFLRQTDDSDIAQVALALSGAIKQVEADTNRALLTASYTGYWSEVKCGSTLSLPRPPFRSVTSVNYIDEDGGMIALSESEDDGYRLTGSAAPQAIEITSDLSEIDAARKSHLIISYEAGYGESGDDFPADLLLAILNSTASLYDGCEVTRWTEDTLKRYRLEGIFF